MKDNKKMAFRPTTLALGALAVLVLASLVLLGGCTKTIDGETYANKPPIVKFANIPPNGQTFSTNPVVYWYGTDEDGLIVGYRYHIATVAHMGGMDPDAYIATVPDSLWTHISVDPALADPKTEGTIPLVADTSNPVLGFVDQWVFLQAFDLEGTASAIVSRLFSRNDNPPTTDILDYSTSLPFVNAPSPGGVVTGIRLNWQGADKIDYPTDPPPFQFQWRLYGPYTKDELTYIQANFMYKVLQTSTGFVYQPGDTLEVCDTTATGISCDTFVIGHDPVPSFIGDSVNYFGIDNPAFVGSEYDHYVLQSCADSGCALASDSCCTDPWVYKTTDTLYDAFHGTVNNQTVTRWFVFWVRSRDDAEVPDPTPAFGVVSVIDPKFERDVLVIDYAKPSSGSVAHRIVNAGKKFWWDALHTWKPDVQFDTTRDLVTGDYHDYVFALSGFTAGVPLDTLLQYKTLILYNDGIIKAELADAKAGPIWKAIDAGVNVWLTARCPIYGTLNDVETPFIDVLHRGGGLQYAYYFRVNRMVFSGWWKHHASGPPFPGPVEPRFDVQDCIGAYSLKPDQWPDVMYDSVKVRTNFYWAFGSPFNPNLPWLPEINWSEAGLGAEVMYLYRSWYGLQGKSHPLGVQQTVDGPFDYNMEGAPCGHRFNAGLFKTVHFNFTPMALDNTDGSVQELVNVVMNFIYDPSITAPVSSLRYPDAAYKVSVSDERARYWRRADQQTLDAGGVLSKEALSNLYR